MSVNQSNMSKSEIACLSESTSLDNQGNFPIGELPQGASNCEQTFPLSHSMVATASDGYEDKTSGSISHLDQTSVFCSTGSTLNSTGPTAGVNDFLLHPVSSSNLCDKMHSNESITDILPETEKRPLDADASVLHNESTSIASSRLENRVNLENLPLASISSIPVCEMTLAMNGTNEWECGTTQAFLPVQLVRPPKTKLQSEPLLKYLDELTDSADTDCKENGMDRMQRLSDSLEHTDKPRTLIPDSPNENPSMSETTAPTFNTLLSVVEKSEKSVNYRNILNLVTPSSSSNITDPSTPTMDAQDFSLLREKVLLKRMKKYIEDFNNLTAESEAAEKLINTASGEKLQKIKEDVYNIDARFGAVESSHDFDDVLLKFLKSTATWRSRTDVVNNVEPSEEFICMVIVDLLFNIVDNYDEFSEELEAGILPQQRLNPVDAIIVRIQLALMLVDFQHFQLLHIPESLKFEYGYKIQHIRNISVSDFLFVAEDEKRRTFLTVRAAQKQVANHEGHKDKDHQCNLYKQILEREKLRLLDHEQVMRRKLSPWLREQMPHFFEPMTPNDYVNNDQAKKELAKFLASAKHPDMDRHASWRDLESLQVILSRVRSFLDRRLTTYQISKNLKFEDVYRSTMREERDAQQRIEKKYRIYPHAALVFNRCYEIFINSRVEFASRVAIMFLMAHIIFYKQSWITTGQSVWSFLSFYLIGFACLLLKVFLRFASRFKWRHFFSVGDQLNEKEDNLFFTRFFGFLEKFCDRLASLFLTSEIAMAFSQIEAIAMILFRSTAQEIQKAKQNLSFRYFSFMTLADIRARFPRFSLRMPTFVGRLPVLRQILNETHAPLEESLQSRNVRRTMVADVQSAGSIVQQVLNGEIVENDIPNDSRKEPHAGLTELSPEELATNSRFDGQKIVHENVALVDDQDLQREHMHHQLLHKDSRWARQFGYMYYESWNRYKIIGCVLSAVFLTFYFTIKVYHFSENDMHVFREREITFMFFVRCLFFEMLVCLFLLAIVVFVFPRMEQRQAKRKMKFASRQHMLILHSKLLHSFPQKNVGRLIYLRIMELRDDTYFVFNNLHVFSHPEIIKEYFDEIDRAFPADQKAINFVENKAHLALNFLNEHQHHSVNPFIALKFRYQGECESYLNFEWFQNLFPFQKTTSETNSTHSQNVATTDSSVFPSPTNIGMQSSLPVDSKESVEMRFQNSFLKKEMNAHLKHIASEKENKPESNILDGSAFRADQSTPLDAGAFYTAPLPSTTAPPPGSCAKVQHLENVNELLRESLMIIEWRLSKDSSKSDKSKKLKEDSTLTLLRKQVETALNFVVSIPNSAWFSESKYSDSWQKADIWVALVVLYWTSSGQEKYASILLEWFVKILQLRHLRIRNMSHPNRREVNVEYVWDPVNKNMLHFDEDAFDTRRAVKWSKPPWKVLGKLVCPQSIAEADFSEYVIQLLTHFDASVGEGNILDRPFVDIPRSRWLDQKFAAQWTLSAITRAHERAFCIADITSLLVRYTKSTLKLEELIIFQEPFPVSKIFCSTNTTTPAQFAQFAELACRLCDPSKEAAEREKEILVMAHLLQTAYTTILQRPGFAHYPSFHSWDFAFRQSSRLRAKVLQYRINRIVDAQENGQYIREQKIEFLDKLKSSMVDEAKSFKGNQRKALLEVVKLYKRGHFTMIPVMSIESRKEYDHRQILYVQDLMRRRQRIPGGISQRVYHIATQTLKDEHMKNDDTLTKPFRPKMTFITAKDIFDVDEDDETSLGKLFPELASKKPASPPSNSNNAQEPASNSASSLATSASSSTSPPSSSASASSSASSSTLPASAGRVESEEGVESSARGNSRSNNHPRPSIPARLIYDAHYPLPYIPKIIRSVDLPVRVDSAVLHPLNMDKLFSTYKKEFRDFEKRHAVHFLDDTRVNARITVEERPFKVNELKTEGSPGLPLLSFDFSSRWYRKDNGHDDDIAREADIIRDEFMEIHEERRQQAEKDKEPEDPSESISSMLRNDFVNETHRLGNRLQMVIRELYGDGYHSKFIYGYKPMSEIYRENIEVEIGNRSKAADSDARHEKVAKFIKVCEENALHQELLFEQYMSEGSEQVRSAIMSSDPSSSTHVSDHVNSEKCAQSTDSFAKEQLQQSSLPSLIPRQHEITDTSTSSKPKIAEEPSATETSFHDKLLKENLLEILRHRRMITDGKLRMEADMRRQLSKDKREKRWRENVIRRMIPDSIQGGNSRRVYGDYVMMKKILDDALDQLKIKDTLDAGKQLWKKPDWIAKDSYWYNFNNEFNKRIDHDCILDYDGDKNHIVLEENAPPLDAPCYRHRKQAIRYILRRNDTPHFDPYWPRGQSKTLTFPMAAALLRETASETESEGEDTDPAATNKEKSTQSNQTKYAVKNVDNDDTDDEYNRYFHECEAQPSFYKDTEICALEATYKLSAYKRPKTDAAIRRAACRELVRRQQESAPPPEVVRIPNRWWCGIRDFFWRCRFRVRCGWKHLILNWDGRIPIALLRGMLVACSRIFWKIILEGKLFERTFTDTDGVLGVFVFTKSYVYVLFLSALSLMICSSFEGIFDVMATQLYESSVEYWIHSSYADCLLSYLVDIFLWDAWRDVPKSSCALTILCFICVTIGYCFYFWGFREDAKIRKDKERKDNDDMIREIILGKELPYFPKSMWKSMDWRNLRSRIEVDAVKLDSFFYGVRFDEVNHRK